MIDRSPRPTSARIAIAVALLVTAATAPYSTAGLALAIGGTVVLALGLIWGRGGAITLGATGLVAGVLGAGIAGAPPAITLLGAVAGVVAWDAGWTAVILGRQLGRHAPGRGLEARRLAVTGGVGVVSAGLGYAVYLPATAGQPVMAVAALVVAVVLLTAALD